jgi:hypothetical protein
MKKFRSLLLKCSAVFLLASPLMAQESAIRHPNQGWRDALEIQLRQNVSFREQTANRSAMGESIPYQNGFDISYLPIWPGTEQQLQSAFEKMRDERIYKTATEPDFPRRSTWLYPRDKCYTRAGHAARSFENQNWIRPGKVFAFGDLSYKTEFDPRGATHWSYHVAAAYRVGDRALILDPSVDFHRPVSLATWISLFSRQPYDVEIAVCDTYSYSAGSRCRGNGKISEERSMRQQIDLLSVEWNSLVNLDKNPTRLLGDQPPWQTRREPSFIVPLRDSEFQDF